MYLFRTTYIGFLILISLSFSAYAEKPDAETIMHHAANRFMGHNRSAEMEMTLIDQFGAEKKYTTCCFQNQAKQSLDTFMVFTSPAQVQGTTYLIQDVNGSNNDTQWFYLPALNKTSRVESTSRSSSFMGSDFSFSDLNRIYPENYVFKIIDETRVNGHDVWRIQSAPKTSEIADHDGYDQSVYDIRKDNFVIIRSVHWLRGSEELKYYEVKNLEQINGIWVAVERQMTLKRDGKIRHKTIIKMSNLKFDQALPPNLFSSEEMDKKSTQVCGNLK